MSDFATELARFAESNDALDVILTGDESDSVEINGVQKPSISKAIHDNFEEIQAAMNGRLAYQTVALMDLAGAPPAGVTLAEVWLDGSNNGLYGWNGSAWVKSDYDLSDEYADKVKSLAYIASTQSVSANAITLTTEHGGGMHNGFRVRWKSTFSATGGVTLKCDQSPMVSLLYSSGRQVGQGDLKSGVYYTAEYQLAGNVWRLVEDSSYLNQVSQMLSLLQTGGYFGVAAGTANAITLTVDGFTGSFVEGLTFRFFAVQNNTGAATLSINAGGNFNIYRENGAALKNGDIRAGFIYTVVYDTPGNVWRLSSAGLANDLLRKMRLEVLSYSGSANAISITANNLPASGTTVLLEAKADNTGAVTIAVNSGAAVSLKSQSGGDLEAGDLKQGRYYLAHYIGSPADQWRLLTDVSPSSENKVGVDINKSKYIDEPYGVVTFLNGSKSVQNNTITVVGLGSSVGNGAGAGVDYAPSKLLVDALADSYVQQTVVHENESIGGQTINQFLAQFNNRTEAEPDFVTITAGMNDFFVGGYNCGQGFDSQESNMKELIVEIKNSGAVPILMTSPHPHPDRYSISIPTNNPIVYPIRTYNVNAAYAFDASAQTISQNLFANADFGGHVLNVGDTLRVLSGSNLGNHVITNISSDRTVMTVDGTLSFTGTETVQVRHVNQDLGSVLIPSATDSKINRQWVAGETAFVADVRFWHGNNMLRRVAKQTGAVLLDVEAAFFEAVVNESHGFDDLYNAGEYNHPNALGYTSSFGKLLSEFARKAHAGTIL